MYLFTKFSWSVTASMHLPNASAQVNSTFSIIFLIYRWHFNNELNQLSPALFLWNSSIFLRYSKSIPFCIANIYIYIVFEIWLAATTLTPAIRRHSMQSQVLAHQEFPSIKLEWRILHNLTLSRIFRLFQ